MEFKGTKNRRVRFMDKSNPEDGFFVEGDNPKYAQVGYNIEVMGEDFGDHNGYTLEMRLADANLDAAAPELLEALQEILKGDGSYNTDRLKHASNCIENMKSIAEQAINKALK